MLALAVYVLSSPQVSSMRVGTLSILFSAALSPVHSYLSHGRGSIYIYIYIYHLEDRRIQFVDLAVKEGSGPPPLPLGVWL